MDSNIAFLPIKRPPLERKNRFELVSDFEPAGDQPTAIKELCQGLEDNQRNQVLLGVTGSGKTFTMAHVIAQTQRPALIMAPNKILAAQLYGEMKAFFPNNAVEYFVSFYDYYQPEAYVPRTDTYIAKDSDINEQIDRMRHAATRAILERNDTIIVASVSCIYGIGDARTYAEMVCSLKVGEETGRNDVLKHFVMLQYERNDVGFERNCFRVRGDVLEVFPSHCEDRAWRISFFGDEVEEICEFDPLTGERTAQLDEVILYPASHYVVPGPTLHQALPKIKEEMKKQVDVFNQQEKYIEAQRIQERTTFDLEMLETTGYCSGIENYSRYLTGRNSGEPPPTLFEYLPEDALVFIDESHVSVPQVGAMYKGDFRRKSTLAEYGFRLPSCVDNRPLKFEEWDLFRPQSIFVSATPAPWELEQTQGVFSEQIVRPTGLTDPECIIRPVGTQVDDILAESKKNALKGERVLVTTLTKKMAEDLTEYLHENGVRVRYLHSDIDTVERIEIIRDLRLGVFDVLVGINLLREGLDIPECSLVCILDADKEGFLRSKTSLVQTIGRAARHKEGRVILYADKITASLEYAIGETQRRREKQQQWNKENNIIPQSVTSRFTESLENVYEQDYLTVDTKEIAGEADYTGKNIDDVMADIEVKMKKAAEDLEFEEAARLRDELHRLQSQQLGLNEDQASFSHNKFGPGSPLRPAAGPRRQKRKRKS
ncbi:MAG: excinuclease ABC subunit UvrB [Alphaproteobacteria bacterium]